VNVGQTPARFLTLLVPAGAEAFFRRFGVPGTDPAAPPPVTDKDIQRLLAAAPDYGIEILGENDQLD
jgi:hypothetical protein